MESIYVPNEPVPPQQQQPEGAEAYSDTYINPECAQMMKNLGYGERFVRAAGTPPSEPPGRDTGKKPIILIEGPPLSSLPVTLESPTTGEPIHKLRAMFRKLRRKYGEHIPLRRDPYVDSDVVAALHAKTFKKFINFFDATFVLFYNPFDDKCRQAKYNIREAAFGTRRENHAYAAVDCTKECELCLKNEVTTFPTMKLFSRGKLVNTYTDPVLLGSDIQTFVETTPVVESPMKTDKCSVQ